MGKTRLILTERCIRHGKKIKGHPILAPEPRGSFKKSENASWWCHIRWGWRFKWRTQHSNLEIKLSLKSCISQMTTQWYQDGSRAWRSSSGSGGCGQKRGSMLNARDLNVLPRRPTAVAAASFSRNPILLHKNHTSKNWSLRVVTFVIFTRSTTVN